jgi:hypothetical protein
VTETNDGAGALAVLLEVGERQMAALLAGDVEHALHLGSLRAAASERLEGVLRRNPDPDLAEGLHRARVANLQARRLARSLTESLRRELAELPPDAGTPVRYGPRHATESRYLDRIG